MLSRYLNRRIPVALFMRILLLSQLIEFGIVIPLTGNAYHLAHFTLDIATLIAIVLNANEGR